MAYSGLVVLTGLGNETTDLKSCYQSSTITDDGVKRKYYDAYIRLFAKC